jgi:histone-lysine N-methyltransferase SETMAR
MCHIAAKFVPRLLTNDQKQRRINMCLELWEKANEDPTFISRIIMGDESWIYGYDPETKQQSSLWKSPQSPRVKKARQVRSSTKSMLIVFFDGKGIVHRKFVPPKMTVNSWLLLWRFETLERKCVTKKTRTLVQPQLAPSSRQRARTHVPENHRVFD